jgi:hypothetical protein
MNNREIAEKLAGAHRESDDPWYSCPLSEEGCINENRKGCTCGRDRQIVAIEKALDACREATIEECAMIAETHQLPAGEIIPVPPSFPLNKQQIYAVDLMTKYSIAHRLRSLRSER